MLYKPTNKWGIINTKGEFIVEPQFGYIKDFDEYGYAEVRTVSEKNAGLVGTKNGYIDKNGNIIIDLLFKNIKLYPEKGLAHVSFGERRGLVDFKGNFIGFTREDIEIENAKN